MNGETVSVLSVPATATTTATTASPVGTYAIVPSGAVAANYAPVYVNGTLTVRAGAPSDIVLAAAGLYEQAGGHTGRHALGAGGHYGEHHLCPCTGGGRYGQRAVRHQRRGPCDHGGPRLRGQAGVRGQGAGHQPAGLQPGEGPHHHHR